jgi:hypothetical protein
MTDSVSSTEKERQSVLHRIWLAQAKALAQTLENTPAAELQAATLNVARQFLSDNGITSDSLKDTGREANAALEAQLRTMDVDAQDELNLPAADWPDVAMK